MALSKKSGANSKTIATMKKMFRNLMLIAVAAMGFTACNDNIEETVRPIDPAEVKMTITADVDETRTWIDEANKKVQWSEDDALKVIENGATYRPTTETAIENGLAKFTVSFPENTTATEFTYNAIYPASRLSEDDADKMDMTKIKVILPDAQNPTATSFDPTADILVAKQIVTNAQPTELSMQFKRLVAMGKMTLTNLPASSTISKVVFTVEGAEENPVAGRNYVDATTGAVREYGYYGATNTITLNYNEPISTRDIYFTCNPFELGAGDKFTVKVVCSDATYTREVTLPEGRTLGFIEGDLSKFSVNMESATKETNFVFPDGEYAVIAVVNNEYYALSSAANGTRLYAVDVTYNPGEGLTTDDATLKWTVAKTDNGYTFKGNNDQYIAWSSGNSAKTQDDVYYLDITEDTANDGRYTVTSKTDATRKLQKNTSNAYFAFYTSTQSGSLYLVPVTISEAPEPSVVKATIAEFLAAAEDSSTMYELTGTITSVVETTYGNFDLTDDTGTVYIYGLCSPEGAQKYWAASGAKLGDDITIQTIRTSFNNAPQGKNAIFVELVSPGTRAFYTVSTYAVEFGSTGGEQVVNVTAYHTNATVTATSDNSAFAVSVNGYNVTVSAAANELEKEVTGNITIKVGDLAETVIKATLAAKPAAGVVEGGSSDFNTISATSTSYSSGKTTAGWAYANCAVLKGGTSDSNPTFKMIGDATNRALCMNGKTSAQGTITSPTITTGCGTLKFNYGLPFSDTKIKFTVEIIQNGEVVKEFTVDVSSAKKLTKYTFEKTIDVTGEFQIAFKNLSPSNSSSNKDRTAIWDVEWTGKN